MKTILSFDVSSANIGWGFLQYDDENIKLIDAGVIKPLKKNKGSLFFRLSDTRSQILELLKKYNPDDIAIEEIIQFMKGKSSAKVIITLTTFNRMLSLLCYDFLEKDPYMINVLTIRSKLKNNNGIKPKKEEVGFFLEQKLNIKIDWFPLTKSGKFNSSNYDMADGIATGYAFIMKFCRENKLTKIK